MKILYTAVDTPIPGRHGGSVHVLELCRALVRRGHEVHLVAPTRREYFGKTATKRFLIDGNTQLDGVILHSLPKPFRFLEWTAVKTIRRLVLSLSPDVVVERFYTFAGAGIWAAHTLKVPAVLEVNSPARSYPGSWRDRLDILTLVRPVDRWRRQLLEWSDAVYTTSKDLLPPEIQAKVHVVVNGVDTQRFRPGSRKSSMGPLRCVYVSSFRAWHGVEDLISAASICAARGVDLRIICVGHGPGWASAYRATRRAGLEAMVKFLGEIAHSDVPEQLARADVGLAPFLPIGFSALKLGWFWSPIKIFEYLAAGLPVVTSDVEELHELLPDAVASFYTAGEPRELADILEKLSFDRDKVRVMGEAARALAESRYTWDQQGISVEQLLEEVIKNRR